MKTNSIQPTRISSAQLLLLALCALVGAAAFAGLSWEKPVWLFVDSITGPVATGVAFLAFVAMGLGWIMGRTEMNEIFKGVLIAIIILSVILLAWNLVAELFGINIQKGPASGHVLPAGEYTLPSE